MNNVVKSPWISFVKTCLDNLGMSECFIEQQVNNVKHFKQVVKTKLYDQFLQEWDDTVFNTSKCSVYRIYKSEHCLEQYFDILPTHLAFYLCKFRTTNHNLPIEKGRHFNIDRNQRFCHLCTDN